MLLIHVLNILFVCEPFITISERKIKSESKATNRLHKHLGRNIEERSIQVQTREEFGHYEADTIGSKTTLLTLVERKTRKNFIVKLAEKNASLKNLNLPIKSITTDNGSESVECKKAVHFPVYYTHPYSSWEKGSIERFNGLIRRFIPKGFDIFTVSHEKISEIENYFNSLPRKFFYCKTPADFFNE